MFPTAAFGRALCAIALFAAAATPPAIAAAPLPADSLYRLPAQLTDNQGRKFDWRELSGRHVLATMFYGTCHTACPIIIESLKQTVAAVKPGAGRLTVLMVSLNPDHDDAEVLDSMAKSLKLDPAVFRLAYGSGETQTRSMAAALQIKYRAVEGGEINHTTRVTLLDPSGRVLASSSQLSAIPDPAFVDQIRRALK